MVRSWKWFLSVVCAAAVVLAAAESQASGPQFLATAQSPAVTTVPTIVSPLVVSPFVNTVQPQFVSVAQVSVVPTVVTHVAAQQIVIPQVVVQQRVVRQRVQAFGTRRVVVQGVHCR